MSDSPLRSPEYIYLASPYGRADASLREERYVAARAATVWLLLRKRWVYSPIVHCHDLAKTYDLPKGFDYWQEYNYAMLLFARAFYILTIPGWQQSDGVASERNFALREGILVRYMARQGEDYEVRAQP